MMDRPLYLKHVGFVGKFVDGTLALKDLVYNAGGAPVDNIAVFTHYIVVGNGGENTKLYKAWLKHIENGCIVPLTVNRLMAIIDGKEEPPVRAENEKDTSPFTEQQKQLEIDVWQDKRNKFVQKYGLPDSRIIKGDRAMSNENALILRPEQSLIDVTDKSLYSFDEREGLSKFREAATIVALDNFLSLADSDAVKFVVYLGEKVPALKNVFDALKGKTELVAKLSDKAKKKLESGEWHWVTTKDGTDFLATLKDEAGHFAEQIKIGEKTIRPDMMNALISLTQQNNLDALTAKIVELTDTVERIAIGQYNDRISMFYEARQTYIEAMAMIEPEDRRIALLNAAHSANKAIASLQQTVKYDLTTLLSAKGKLADKTQLIAKCFSILNDSVQIAVNSYASLGENRALLAAVTSYQCFVEQSLLATPEKGAGKKYSGCTLAEIMHSCAELDGTNWIQLPHEIVNACETLIQTERETIAVIADAIELDKLGGQEDEEV